MVKPAVRGIELEPIDRLEDKVKRLVSLLDEMKAEQVRTTSENERLLRELDALRARVSSSEALAAELTALRDEREVIRTRVSDMLEQLDALNL
jgi:regulator of replication initiation timing